MNFFALNASAQAPAEPVVISTEKNSYLLNEKVNLTIENKTENDIKITLACGGKPFVYLLKKDGANWIRRDHFPMKACGGAAYTIKPGEKFTNTLDLQAMFTLQTANDTQPVTEGEYKFEIQIDRSSENDKIFSNEFAVTLSRSLPSKSGLPDCYPICSAAGRISLCFLQSVSHRRYRIKH